MTVYRTITREIPAYREDSASPLRLPSFPIRLGLLGSFTAKFALVLTTLFITMLTLTHAQSYSNNDLRALIAPSADCTMPCWNGVQPGITTVNEALALLQANPAVADYQVSTGKISWWWNGEQAALLDASGRAFHGRMETAIVNGQETITSIVLDTTVLMGDIRLTFGNPESLTLYTVQPQEATRAAGIVYVADYREMSVFTTLACPMNVNDFWSAPSYIAFGTPNLAFEGETFQFDSLPDWFFRDLAPGCSTI